MVCTIWPTGGQALRPPGQEYDETLERAASLALEGAVPADEAMFWAFVVLRQCAWYRKEVLRAPPPWTADPIINEWRFTNVYRELDRGTLFLAHEVLERADSREQGAVLAVMYRAFNRVDTWLSLVNACGGAAGLYADLTEGGAARTYRFFEQAQAAGAKVFTGAYMMTAMAKVFHERRLGELVAAARAASRAGGLQAATRALEAAQHVGKFTAFQMAMDMAIPVAAWRGRPVLDAPNLDHHVEVGPGSGAGARIVRRDLPPLTTMRYLRENQFLRIARIVPGPFPYPRLGDGTPVTLRMVDVEHALCEYAKHVSAMNGGRMRSRLSTVAAGSRMWAPPSPVPPGWGDWYARGNR